jgi:transposase
MAAPPRLFRFLLSLQAAVVTGARIDPVEESLIIRVRRRSHASPRCSRCGEVLTGEITCKIRRWRHLDAISRRCYVEYAIREGYCSRHGRRVEGVPWAAPAARHTHDFDRHVAALVQVANRTAVARVFGISWRTTGRIIERVVDKELPRDLLSGLTAIAVDETSYKRGHRYLTIVFCLISARVVWIGEGKSAAVLGQFFEALGKRKARKLEVVAMDMNGAYKKAVDEWAPNADVIYDRFHVVKLLLDAVDEVRRAICRELEGDQRKTLKGTRFALLRNPRHRTPRDSDTIATVVSRNRKLIRTYELRVDFEELWSCRDEDEARDFLMRWTRAALLSRRKPLRRFANTIRTHIDGVLGFFRWHGQTSSPIEGMNNKIKLLIHKAFGFRSVPALMAMIHLCCSGIDLT